MLTFCINLHFFTYSFADDVNISPVKEADSKSSKNDVISNNIPVTSTQASNTDRDSILQLANENPLGIKIKEITKPEEIRITDDKPKPFNPFKTTSTTTSTTTIASTTVSLDVTTETDAKAATESSTITLTTETLKESKELSTEDTNQSPNRGEHDVLDNGVGVENNSPDAPSSPPPVKALVEPETLLNSGADSNSIADDASNKNVRQIIEHSTSGSDIDQFSEVNDFSSTTELSTDTFALSDGSTTEHGEEGDMIASSTPQNVVFFRSGGKTEPFHISGTDGLIRVEELEIDVSSTTENDNSSNQESTPRDAETSSDDGISSASSEFPSMESSTPTTSEPETLDETGTVSLGIEKQLDSALSSNATGIDNLSNNSIEVSTLDDGLESSSEFASSERVYQTVYYRSDEKLSTASPLDERLFETVYYPPSSTEDSSESSSTIEPDSSSSTTSTGDYSTTDQSTTESLSTAKPTDSFDEEQEVTPDTNPYYPVDIPVDVSIHNKVNEQDEKRRLPSKVMDDAIPSSTSGPSCDDCDDVDKIVKEASSTQGPSDQEIKKSHENDVIESRVPGEPNLIPEWERNSTEKTLVTEASTTLGPPNDTEINALNKTVASNENDAEKVNKSAALMLETTVAPVDSDEIYGRKEPTTARSTTKGYANVNDSDDSDDTSAPSSAQQLENSTTDGALPDDDAESIKFTSSASEDDDTNESYETRPLKMDIPDSIQNYWRYVSKINGWTV